MSSNSQTTLYSPLQPSSDDAKDLDDRVIKDKLRKILKRLGKLKCSREVKGDTVFMIEKEGLIEWDVRVFSLSRAVMLPSPALWAMCTTWRSVGRRSRSWRRCCWAALTAERPTSPRRVWSTTWNQSTLQWVILCILPSNRATLDQMFGVFFNCLHLPLTHRHLRRARRTRLWKLGRRPIQSGQPAAGCSAPPPR